MDEVASGLCSCVSGGGAWHVASGRKNFHCFGDALSGRRGDKHAVASVVFWSVAQIPSFLSVNGPRASFFGRLVHDDASAQRSEWLRVEIEGAIEVRLRRETWIQARCAKKVYCCGGLWQDAIPQSHWKKLVGCAQACHEVIFERLYGTLGGVAMMCVWRHELEVNVFVSDCSFECVGGFVVELLQEGFEATVYKELVQFVVGS
jgi:hypothetical protein